MPDITKVEFTFTTDEVLKHGPTYIHDFVKDLVVTLNQLTLPQSGIVSISMFSDYKNASLFLSNEHKILLEFTHSPEEEPNAEVISSSGEGSPTAQ